MFGGSGNQAVFILEDDDIVFRSGTVNITPLSFGDGGSLTPTKLEILCTNDIIRMACGIGPHIIALSLSGEVFFSWGHNGFCATRT